MDIPGQPLLTDTMVDHCSITMVKPCLTIVKTNHASPILQKCQNHGEAWSNHCIPCYSMVLQLWFSMVKHGLTMVKHGYAHIISQGESPLWLWPFDLKIYRAHPCLMGSLHAKFHDDRCKEKAVMRQKPFSVIYALWPWTLTFWPQNL